jgi:CHAT domain-containing protein
VFEPFVNMVEGIAGQRQHLAIIGDGPQAMIPFEALIVQREQGSRPLVHRSSVSYRPWLRKALTGEWMPREDNGRVLMVGDVEVPLDVHTRPGDHDPLSSAGQQVSGMVQPLPGTLREMSLVEDHFGSQVDVLRGAAATDARFCANAPDYWIVHLATHGAARGPGRRAHVLYLSPSSGTEGEVKLEDILPMEMKGSLVVLPVCYSGQASLTDDVESMAHAFLEAGAGSVLAARWSVDDELAVEFLSVFYGALGKGETKRAAVRIAMNEMIARGHHSYRVWAGFQLFGDGGALSKHDPGGNAGRVRRWMILLGIAAVLTTTVGYLWRRWPRRRGSHADGERRD